VNSAVIDSAAFDAATGTIVLQLRGKPPLHLTASTSVLGDLKAAVQDCYTRLVQDSAAPKKRRGTGAAGE
jgi:hypothetical protein